ncbi:hypothetical protein LVJ94_46735 [Pendulispora rubella]|uniref:VWFA domain-containing protein n=1 Tax=Pendulispora rubella TaxID=2741070 RepID=A0ABZ2L0B9_9BACT
MPRRTLLVALPAIASIVAVVAQGCSTGTEDMSEFSNYSQSGNGDGSNGNDDGGGINIGDGALGSGKDASWDGTACAGARAEAFRVPIYMQIVQDGSGSMDAYNGSPPDTYIPGGREKDPLNPTRPAKRDDGKPSCGLLGCEAQWAGLTGKKWLAARGSLTAFVDSLSNEQNTTFGVGFLLFSSTDPGNFGDYSRVDIPINRVDANQASRIKARMAPKGSGADAVYPQGGTPLYASITGQGAVLAKFDPAKPPTSLAAGGKRILVVITDGVPSPRDANTQAQENEAVRAAVAALKAGNPSITTFVIGVGDPTGPEGDYDEGLLGKMAVAGGAPTAGCNPNWANGDVNSVPCHFQITPGDRSAQQIAADFIKAMNSIRDIVVPCDFPLEKSSADAGQIDPTRVNVVYEPGGGGPPKQLDQSSTDGWVYNNYNADAGELPSKITLNGNACKTLKSDPGGKIRIVLGCKTGDEVIKVN